MNETTFHSLSLMMSLLSLHAPLRIKDEMVHVPTPEKNGKEVVLLVTRPAGKSSNESYIHECLDATLETAGVTHASVTLLLQVVGGHVFDQLTTSWARKHNIPCECAAANSFTPIAVNKLNALMKCQWNDFMRRATHIVAIENGTPNCECVYYKTCCLRWEVSVHIPAARSTFPLEPPRLS